MDESLEGIMTFNQHGAVSFDRGSSRRSRGLAVAALAGGLAAIAAGCSSESGQESPTPDAADVLVRAGGETPDASSEALKPAVQYFTAVRDVRRCASPRCGGYFVRAVNRALTRCADGSFAERCYVAEIDWNAAGGEPESAGTELMVRGRLEPNVFPGIGNFGRLVAAEGWGSASIALGSGAFFRLADTGLRCITDPCFFISAELLNFGTSVGLSDLDLSAVGASELDLERASQALADGTLLAAGTLRVTSGTAGAGLLLRSSQFYLPEDSSCSTDADCAEGWCRGTESGGYECVPFAGEGGRCGGFRPPWTFERCSPELVCDLPERVADAPGVCRSPCKSNEDCDPSEYCSTDGLCHPDGTCDLGIDCVAPGNNYPHILCVGHPVCPLFGDGDRCGWTCADPRCIDLYGANFGPCDAVLGWGVVDGNCTQVSGCSSGEFELFATQEECVASCGK
jgi:hypothetical protein